MAQQEHLNAIVSFVESAKSGSFTTAAQRLGVTKSAVGKSVSRLEDHLGVKLMHRSTRRLSLTADGEAYLASCDRALEELAAAEASLMSQRETPRGQLRIDMPVAYGRRVLMPILLGFAGSYPELRLLATFSDTVIDPVAEGVDLVVRFGETRDVGGVISRKLLEQERFVVASPDYLDRHGRPEVPDDLRGHRGIVGLRGSVPTPWVLSDGRGGSLSLDPPPTHRLGDGEAMLAAVLAGHGLAQMPSFLVRADIEAGRLVAVLRDCSTVRVSIYALWPKTRHPLPKVRMLIDELVSRAAAGDLG